MNNLELNQKILADSTCYFSSCRVVELCPTTLEDAINTPQGVRVKLGDGHDWGAIHHRDRSRVIAEISDLREFFDTKISGKKGIEQRLKEGKSLLRVYQNEKNRVLYVVEYTKGTEVDSLKDGKYVVFSENGLFKQSVKVFNGNTGTQFYTDTESAFKALKSIAETLL